MTARQVEGRFNIYRPSLPTPLAPSGTRSEFLMTCDASRKILEYDDDRRLAIRPDGRTDGRGCGCVAFLFSFPLVFVFHAARGTRRWIPVRWIRIPDAGDVSSRPRVICAFDLRELAWLSVSKMRNRTRPAMRPAPVTDGSAFQCPRLSLLDRLQY